MGSTEVTSSACNRLDCVAAGVVTFNPDVELLLANLRAVSPQVQWIFLFDNASDNFFEVQDAIRNLDNIKLIPSARNVGIAAALNALALKAESEGYDWLLTLDQDSVCAPGMVQVLWSNANSSTPLVTPYIIDRNKISLDHFLNLDLPRIQYFRRAASKGAITSGGLLNIRALREIGGFDERMFIDYVDYDLNMRLLGAGYGIARVNGTYLLHEVGQARKTWLRTPRKTLDGRWAWEPFYSFGHSPQRCYFKSRNRVIYSRKYWKSIRFSNEGIAQIPQQVFLTLMFEKDRSAKLRAFTRGIIDGFRVPLNPPAPPPFHRLSDS
jgi:rhamnosyltransferase